MHAPRPPSCPDGSGIGPPDFVGVGAQRSGTSWWHGLLLAHPDIHRVPDQAKELHYFDQYYRVAFTEAAAQGYAQYFPRPPGKLCGEWTPRYLSDHWVAPCLHAAAPEAKLLVLLRDPVTRYESGLTHEWNHGAGRHPSVAVEAFHRGMYHAQLEWLRRYFDPQKTLVLQYERCCGDPEGELTKTYRFLGVDDGFVPADLRPTVNETRGERFELSPELRRRLAMAYASEIQRLARDYPEIDLSLWPNFAAVGSSA